MIPFDDSMTRELFDIFRFVFGLLVLSYASYSDLRSRKVKNSVWIIMGVVGGIILFFNLFIRDIDNIFYYLLTIGPILILFMYFLTCEYVIDLEKKKVNYPWLILIILGISIIIYQIFVFWENILTNFIYLHLISILLLIFIFYIFYLTNLLHGGADTKAMMAIAILVPFYPEFAGFPLLKTTFDLPSTIALQLVFPYALIILFNAVILSIFIPIGFAIYNTTKGHFKFPHMFLGYKMDVDIKNAKKFVWLMERVDDGKLYSVLRPSKVDDLKLEDELKKFQDIGIKKVWVTPQIPFMITLAIGYVFAFLIGNIMFLIVGLFA